MYDEPIQGPFETYADVLKRIKPRDSYHQSYLALLRHFTAVSFWNIDSLIVAAHAVYGWMPTILEINPKGDGDVSRAAESLNRAQREFFADQDLENLVRVVNNSLVGASKLLHFTAPDKFAIWDSNVYRSFSGQSPHQYRLRNTSEFKRYHDWLNSVRGDPRSDELVREVSRVLGYGVTHLRALEIVMFYGGRGQDPGSGGPSRVRGTHPRVL